MVSVSKAEQDGVFAEENNQGNSDSPATAEEEVNIASDRQSEVNANKGYFTSNCNFAIFASQKAKCVPNPMSNIIKSEVINLKTNINSEILPAQKVSMAPNGQLEVLIDTSVDTCTTANVDSEVAYIPAMKVPSVNDLGNNVTADLDKNVSHRISPMSRLLLLAKHNQTK